MGAVDGIAEGIVLETVERTFMHPVQEIAEELVATVTAAESDERETGTPTVTIELETVSRREQQLPDPLLGMYFTG